MTPLEEEAPQDIFGKNIRVVPLMNETNEENTVLLVLKRGTLNNKNDEFTDTPIDGFDHFCDAWRYGLYSEYAQRQVNFRYS